MGAARRRNNADFTEAVQRYHHPLHLLLVPIALFIVSFTLMPVKFMVLSFLQDSELIRKPEVVEEAPRVNGLLSSRRASADSLTLSSFEKGTKFEKAKLSDSGRRHS